VEVYDGDLRAAARRLLDNTPAAFNTPLLYVWTKDDRLPSYFYFSMLDQALVLMLVQQTSYDIATATNVGEVSQSAALGGQLFQTLLTWAVAGGAAWITWSEDTFSQAHAWKRWSKIRLYAICSLASLVFFLIFLLRAFFYENLGLQRAVLYISVLLYLFIAYFFLVLLYGFICFVAELKTKRGAAGSDAAAKASDRARLAAGEGRWATASPLPSPLHKGVTSPKGSTTPLVTLRTPRGALGRAASALSTQSASGTNSGASTSTPVVRSPLVSALLSGLPGALEQQPESPSPAPAALPQSQSREGKMKFVANPLLSLSPKGQGKGKSRSRSPTKKKTPV
jgi:hypothetical protein